MSHHLATQKNTISAMLIAIEQISAHGVQNITLPEIAGKSLLRQINKW